MAARYQYETLGCLGNDSIRILTLHPGKPSDQLVGTLAVVSIESDTTYEALSYVWADPGSRRSANEILIRDGNNEAILNLRGGSIVAALHQLRLPDRPRRIWTDQCCINQDDPVERSMQVQFMNRIYRNAAHILVWLGLDTRKEADLAFNLVCKLDKILDSSSVHDTCSESQKRELVSYVSKNHETLKALTNRAWFTRGWIVQEIGTQAPATLHWGEATLDWDLLASVCMRLKSYHQLRGALDISTSDISFLYRRFVEPDESTHHANRFNFVYELQRARHLQFSDGRDRVFAFLGHFSARTHHALGCGPVSIVADYTKTVVETYIEVAVRILRENPAALCILLASVQHRSSSLPSNRPESAISLDEWLKNKDQLPSWVPDWRRSEGIILAEPICPHRAHGNSTANVEIMEGDNLVLRVHGMNIDTIEASSQPLSEQDLYGKKTRDQPLTMIERLWRDICKKSLFNLKEVYRNGQPALFAFMQTLSNGCVQAAGHKSAPYQEVPETVWQQKGAKYIVDTIGALDEAVSDDVGSAAEVTKHEAEYDNWCRWAASASDSRIFAKTKAGYYVLGPAALEPGDIVCVLFGSKVPFCLRPMGVYMGQQRYLLVGECYVHGLMKGEAMDMLAQTKLHETTFTMI